MTHDEIRAFVCTAIERIAPDADPSTVDGGESLRDELDLDSMDFLALVRAIHDELGVDVPEVDYGEIETLDGCVAYLAPKLADR